VSEEILDSQMKHENRYLHGFSFDRLFGELALASTLPRPTSPFLGMICLRSAFTGALFATGVPFSPLVKHAVAADTVLLPVPLGSAVFDAGFGFTASTALALPAHVTKNICYCKT
jgi:hypothetical protein